MMSKHERIKEQIFEQEDQFYLEDGDINVRLAIPAGSYYYQEENITVYHSGTAITEDGTLVTNGGRVLGVTATAPRLTAAVTQAYAAAEKISFEKLHKRTDIGLRALKAIAEG